MVVERSVVGGQASSSSKIENYLGSPEGINGVQLAERARAQACRFGAELLVGREGVRGEFVPGKGVGYLADGTKIVAKATICATGVDYRRLICPMRTGFWGRVFTMAPEPVKPRCATATKKCSSWGRKLSRTGGDALFPCGEDGGTGGSRSFAEGDALASTCWTGSAPRPISACLRTVKLPNSRETRCSRRSPSQIVTAAKSSGMRRGGCLSASAEIRARRGRRKSASMRDEGGYLVTGPDLMTGSGNGNGRH